MAVGPVHRQGDEEVVVAGAGPVVVTADQRSFYRVSRRTEPTVDVALDPQHAWAYFTVPGTDGGGSSSSTRRPA